MAAMATLGIAALAAPPGEAEAPAAQGLPPPAAAAACARAANTVPGGG